MAFLLGKKPHVPGAVSWHYRDIFDRKKLMKPPLVFGHIWNATPVPMLGNDRAGNCVWCTQAHILQAMQRGIGKKETVFSDDSVFADYSAVTGFALGDPSTDQGTGMADGASYWRKTGIHDASGKAHPISAYVSLRLHDIDELMQAAFDFGGVALGVQLPKSAEEQWDHEEPWHYWGRKSSILGGHAVALLGRNHNGDAVIATWNGITAASTEWIVQYMDEALAFFSLEYLDERGINPRGFDRAELEKRIGALA